jgi:hypothetical protein
MMSQPWADKNVMLTLSQIPQDLFKKMPVKIGPLEEEELHPD